MYLKSKLDIERVPAEVVTRHCGFDIGVGLGQATSRIAAQDKSNAWKPLKLQTKRTLRFTFFFSCCHSINRKNQIVLLANILFRPITFTRIFT